MALALLRLDEVEPGASEQKHSESGTTAAAIRKAIEKALTEIRGISAGLSLPELDGMLPEMVIRLAVESHQRLTKSEVFLTSNHLPDALPLALKTCLFRCVQESLNNAFRHADCRGQRVQATGDDSGILLTIEDSGPGFHDARLQDSAKLGISGMRHRVQSIGGTFNIASKIGSGTKVTITLPRKLPHDE
jgi:signal transduction histidine kinase